MSRGSLARVSRGLLRACSLAAVLGLLGVFGGAVKPMEAAAAPAMPDPRQMSGIPRPDPAVPADELTVRCLLGGFSEPAVGVEVTVSAADGGAPLSLKATTDAAGRATITGLSGAVGRTVRASATLGEGSVETLPITIRRDMGSRVLLVQGATTSPTPGAAPGARSPHGSAGGDAAGYREGVPFALPADAAGGRPPGTLVVGIIEPRSDQPQPQAGRTIVVEISAPGGDPNAPIRREAQTDVDGRAFFTELVSPAIPEGSTLVVIADVVDGEPPRQSAPFRMGNAPMAMVFTPSRMLDAPPKAPPTPTQPVVAQPPRPDAGLPPGTLMAQAIDGTGAPTPGLSVTAERSDMTGQRTRWTATTDARGEVRFDDLPTGNEAVYSVIVERDGAPFRSSLFELIEAAGVRAQVRTFPVSDDRNLLKSAVQVEIRPLENSESQVIQIYEVFADGEAAYWSPNEVRITGAEGAHGLQIMPQAQRWLKEREGAQFATLARPIEPGQVVQLSTAYLMPHDGEASYTWTAPFPLVQATAVLAPELPVSRGAKGPGRAPPHEQGGTPASVLLYDLNVGEWREGTCASDGAGCTAETWPETGASVEFAVANLPTSPTWSRQIGVALLAVFGGLIAGTVLFRRRVSAVDALEARRASLLKRLAALDAEVSDVGAPDHVSAREALVTALDGVCRKLDSLRGGGHNRGA